MPREDLQKHTLNLREGDYEYLQQVFGPSGMHASTIIRKIISRHVDQLRAQEEPITLTLNLKEPTDE